MTKMMLTVLKANQSGMNFYIANSFEDDPTSPDYCEDGSESSSLSGDGLGLDTEEIEEADFRILSRVIPRKPAPASA